MQVCAEFIMSYDVLILCKNPALGGQKFLHILRILYILGI